MERIENTHDFIARLQKRKMMEDVEVKQTHGTVEATGKELSPDMEGRKPEMKPKKAQTKKQAKKVEDDVEHSIQQCQPQKGSTPKGSMKIDKPKPAPELKQPKDAKDTVKHSIKQCELGSKNESIFVLAGIENILTSEDAKKGAVGAMEILKNYMGGNIDPQFQEFIDMFTNILKRDPRNADKSRNDIETRGQKFPN